MTGPTWAVEDRSGVCVGAVHLPEVLAPRSALTSLFKLEPEAPAPLAGSWGFDPYSRAGAATGPHPGGRREDFSGLRFPCNLKSVCAASFFL